MPVTRALTLSKEERISGRKQIEKLFGGGSRSLSAFPLRLVYLLADREPQEPAAKILVSVPKRHFKHAVKRNRVKRQVREAYRKNKHLLLERMETAQEKTLLMAFIWLDRQLHDSAEVDEKVCSLLQRVGEKL